MNKEISVRFFLKPRLSSVTSKNNTMKTMKINKGIVSLAIVVAGIAGVSQVSAVSARQDASKTSEHRATFEASVVISRVKVTGIAQGLLAGTLKQIHLDRGNHGKATWKVRILSTDGTQRGDFRIDATTGVVLKSVIKPIGSGHGDQATRIADKLEKEKLHLAEKAHKRELKKQYQESKGQSSK